tara:strand:- start:116 stop:700 length:585 start_codon:yes stop_codon:yes gene_type:complete
MRIICVNTGNKFGQWYVDNLKHMIDNYSGLKYDSFEVIEEEKYKGVFNKLQMFDKFRDGENLYFDLDICIYNKVPNLIRKNLTVLKAWWRDRHHTSFNSSVISWTGDQSYIYKTFIKDVNMWQEKYNKGIDQMLEENFEVDNYDKICYSIKDNEYKDKNTDYSMVLFNQRQYLMLPGWSSWWTDYFLPISVKNI